MSGCPPSCRCWPRRGQAFTPDEQDFLAAATDNYVANTAQVFAMAEAMVRRVGRDRMGYLLSVPVNYQARGEVFLVWPAMRLSTSWFFTLEDAVGFLRLMVQCGACLACPMYEYVGRRGYRFVKGWVRGMEEHPGRCHTGLLCWSTAMGETSLGEAWARLAPQIRRWDARGAKRLWLAV